MNSKSMCVSILQKISVRITFLTNTSRYKTINQDKCEIDKMRVN
jgi:hypothetical protein